MTLEIDDRLVSLLPDVLRADECRRKVLAAEDGRVHAGDQDTSS